MRIEFMVGGDPQGKGRPRFNRYSGRAYTPDQTVAYEDLVRFHYQRQCGAAYIPDGAPIRMEIRAYYKIPKGTSKKKHDLMARGIVRPLRKPDVDNVVKIIADSLNGIAYRDDAAIVETYIEKYYSPIPHVVVTIETVDEPFERV